MSRMKSLSMWAGIGLLAFTLSACGTGRRGEPAPLPPPPPPPEMNDDFLPPPPPPPPPEEGIMLPPAEATNDPYADMQVLPGSIEDFHNAATPIVFFDLDSHSVRADAAETLAQQAAWLLQYPMVDVRIEGNCDERGTREYNLALGAKRANSVKDFLVAQGVEPNRISTISYGKERPLDPGSNEAAWAQNRNAQTVVIEGATQPL